MDLRVLSISFKSSLLVALTVQNNERQSEESNQTYPDDLGKLLYPSRGSRVPGSSGGGTHSVQRMKGAFYTSDSATVRRSRCHQE